MEVSSRKHKCVWFSVSLVFGFAISKLMWVFFSVFRSHYSTLSLHMIKLHYTIFSSPAVWKNCVILVKFRIEEASLPSLPVGSLSVVMCWCSARGQCLFISLTSPIKIHSANEPSLSPPVIKTYRLICTALSPTGRGLSFSSTVTPLRHGAHADIYICGCLGENEKIWHCRKLLGRQR